MQLSSYPLYFSSLSDHMILNGLSEALSEKIWNKLYQDEMCDATVLSYINSDKVQIWDL